MFRPRNEHKRGRTDVRNPRHIPARSEVGDNTPLRLAVAAILAYPDGSMTASGLRREAARGRRRTSRKSLNFQRPAASAPRSGRGGRRFKSCHSDQHLAEIQTSTGTDCGTVSLRRSGDQPPRPDVTLVAESSGQGRGQAERPSRPRCESLSLSQWHEVGRCPQGR
jgi:hypothetical protein